MLYSIDIKGIALQFETNENLFSPGSADRGTLAMLEQVVFSEQDKVLDLGCGYGIVGILAAKLIGADRITMCDIDPEAVAAAQHNAQLNEVEHLLVLESNGFQRITDKDYTLILSNPPYHTDFSVPKYFIEEGYKRLTIGGRMLMVTKRRDWYKNKFIAIFGGVQIVEKDGYYVFEAQKRLYDGKRSIQSKKRGFSKKLQKKLMKKSEAKSVRSPLY